VYPGDDMPGVLHVAVVDGDEVVGVASLSPEPHPADPRAGDGRLRGMATAPAIRGAGHGAALIGACVAHARERRGTRIWCNARRPAEGFYVRQGFVVEGAPFDIPGIGPHVVMTRGLATS